MNIMIKKYLLTILSIPVLSILLSIQYCNAYVSWASTNQNQYPGAADAVFKDLGPNAWGIPVSFQVGHAAIFYQYGTDGSRQVIQANGYSAPSSIASWSDFLGGLEYWGAYSQSRIDASAREEILYIATTYCLNIPYALNRGHYKDPPNSLRCDGLVEYCYERAFGEENSPAYTQPNQGIVPNDQYDGNALRLWSFALDSDSSEHYMTPEIVMEWINNQSTVDDPTTDDHDWGSGNSRQGKNSINHNPALTSGTVSPSSGYANSTSFTYSVSYSDADLDVPVTAYVYIDGNPHTMTFVSGKAYNGIYQYITTLSSGSHSYYFYFIDNQNKSGSCRLPSSGNYSGPIITIPPAISVSPSDGLTSSGNQGGPFSPSSKQYSVSNSGGGTLNWTASANQNWVTVSPTSGTNSGTATVSINSNANSLSGGATYIATVTFGGNGGSTARQVSLTVQNQTAIINMTIGPLPVDFGTVSVGQSVQQNLTITNGSNSTGALIGSVGTPPVPFSLVSDNAFNLAPGQSKIFTFRFSPTTNDTFNNSFAVTSNATNQVSPVNLSMCGVGFGGPSYGMTITSCAISNTNPNTGQAVTLTGMGGQVHGVTSGDLIKVVVGFRDGSGNWRGGEPVLVSSTVPGQSFQPWSYSSGVSVNAPSSSGTYYVWVRSVPTVTNATAIQDFKNAAPTSADQQRDDKWSTPLTVNGNDPLFGNLLLYKQDGTQILGNVPIDNPVRANGTYTVGSDGSNQALSRWEIISGSDVVFTDTCLSGDLTSCWLPGNALNPGTAYTLKVRAKNSNSIWSEWVSLDFNTIPQIQSNDSNGDGVPDDQTPTNADLISYGFVPYNPGIPDSGLPDTALIVKFNNEPILVESTGNDTISYFAGITPSEVPPSDYSNPYGVFTTRIEVPVGTSITLTYTFPATLPSGTLWYKYDESATAGNKWVEYPDAFLGPGSNQFTIQVTDGGEGDADGVANGIIIDPSGPISPPPTPPPNGGGDKGGGGGAAGPLAVGISTLLGWWKRRKRG